MRLIKDQLAQSGFHVLVDEDSLKVGDHWREKLMRDLGICHGAVVLINERSLEPDKKWVETEANILRWRKWNEPEFPLLMLRLGDVTVDRIRAAWEPLDFTGLQILPRGGQRLASDDLAEAAVLIGEIIAALQSLFARVGEPTPMERIRDAVAESLRQAVGEKNVRHVRQVVAGS